RTARSPARRTSTAGAWTASSASLTARSSTAAAPSAQHGVHAPPASECDELPRRGPDPELLGIRTALRPPGPHVRAELGLEPAGAPLALFRLVCSLQRPVPAEHVHDEPPGPGQRGERDAAAASPRSALRVDRPHLAPPPLPRHMGVVR